MRVSNQESQESSAKSWVVVEVEPFEVYFSLRSGHNIQLFACSALIRSSQKPLSSQAFASQNYLAVSF